MSNNDEFILAPPGMLDNAAGPDSSRFKSRGTNKLDEIKIIQPDHTLHSFRLPKHALGIDCIDKVSISSAAIQTFIYIAIGLYGIHCLFRSVMFLAL